MANDCKSQLNPVHTPHVPLPEDMSKYYPPIYSWVSHVVTVSGFPTKTLHITLPPYALQALPISFFSI